MKEIYIEPEIEIIHFTENDIMCTESTGYTVLKPETGAAVDE